MIKARGFFALIILLSGFFTGSCLFEAAEAGERILLFHSQIRVDRDGSMEVRETITVNAEGQSIKRGIYRDFPTSYKDRLGNNYAVDFTLLDVKRDGIDESYHIKQLSNGRRVYIGREDYLIPAGEHTYTITYRTNRQIGFFQDYDELYWNVTGNGWDFPIEKAQAVITLPADAGAHIRSRAGYTGSFGQSGQDFSVSTDHSGNVVFTSTRPFAPHEGLTVAVSWPKGYVTEPDLARKAEYFFRDNRAVLLAIMAALFVLAYYLVVWHRFGRDPQKGTIVPLFTPPNKLSAASMRYIMKMGYDGKAFAAAIIDMAVKGFLEIGLKDGVYTLKRIAESDEALSQEERKLAKKLFSPFWAVELKSSNHYIVRPAAEGLKADLKKSCEKTYFLTNTGYFIRGLILSVVCLLPAIIVRPAERMSVAIFMLIWLSIWSIGVSALGVQVFSLWKGVFMQAANRSLFLGGALALSLFGLPFFIGEIVGIGVLAYALSPAVFALIAIIAVINIVFYRLLKAPTFAGRMVMDKIEGFRMYLGAAEKDRLRVLHPPEETPEIFEKYLPYALALDVEQEWAEKFSGILRKAAEAGKEYSPSWYHGVTLSSVGLSGFASGLSSGFSGAISSASSAPGSHSGSGGGGSSGGGGGGGGGGGW